MRLTRLLPFVLILPGISHAERLTPDQFLGRYCLECHDDVVQKGERRFDELFFPVEDHHGVIAVQEMIDQLNLGHMPPKDADLPSDEDRATMIVDLTGMVERAAEKLRGTGAQTKLRRLNQREYVNTLEDLLGRDLSLLDPTASFPSDQEVAHMDNIGDTLQMSSHLLDRHLEAADLVIEKALGMKDKPEAREWQFEGNFQQGQELSAHKAAFNYKYLCVYAVQNTGNFEGGYGYIHEFQEGVPTDGYYDVQVLAYAKHRDTPYDPEIFGMDFAEPFRLGIVPGNRKAGALHHPQAIEPQIAEVTMRDGEPEWYTMRVWLEAGQTPRFIFPNGMKNCRNAFTQIKRRYQDHWPEKERKNNGIGDARRIVLTHGKMPHIRIHKVKVKGPIYEQWPPASQQLVFGKNGFETNRVRDTLRRFANRAYRRPATAEEVENLVAVYHQRKDAGHSTRQAVLDAMKAALCSPAFLYLAEPGKVMKSGGQKLGAHDLASRLSYFLWSTMPDPELRKLADNGQILKEEVLLAQTRRMLKDPRADELASGFLGSWLNLRALGDLPPDRSTFEVYYAKDLGTAMKTEAELFFQHLIETDGPITDFLNSDYTFVNKPLAQLYQLPDEFEPKKAHQFKKVSLKDQRRGGLLGMAGVLTVTANGIDTSPITRGVWLLENVLGTPPPKPPDEVPSIEPDIRGAKTIRDQLVKHREMATCYSCHEKIDPPGFALENFDPIGQWRTHYPIGKRKGPEIDASGELSNGKPFEDIVGFKELLAEQKPLFSKMLTERLLTYGIGRRVEALDRPIVNDIVEEVETEGDGLRTMIEKVALSDVFRSR